MRCSDRSGMTMIELLVGIGIIAVLMTLVVGAIARSRASARQLQCTSNIRGASILLLSASASRGDRLPYGGAEERDVVVNDSVTYRIGGDRGLGGRAWTALFPDEWSGAQWNKAYRCPRQPASNNDASDGLGGPTWFWLSSAIWLDPSTLSPGSASENVKPKQNNLADVASPSKKVFLFEMRAFCDDTAGVDFWIAVGQTPLHPSSTVFIDGSVRRTIRQQGTLGVDGVMPYDYTVNGIRGMDVP